MKQQCTTHNTRILYTKKNRRASKNRPQLLHAPCTAGARAELKQRRATKYGKRYELRSWCSACGTEFVFGAIFHTSSSTTKIKKSYNTNGSTTCNTQQRYGKGWNGHLPCPYILRSIAVVAAEKRFRATLSDASMTVHTYV